MSIRYIFGVTLLMSYFTDEYKINFLCYFTDEYKIYFYVYSTVSIMKRKLQF